MSTIVIGAKIQADTGQATQSVKSWKQEIKEAKEALKGASDQYGELSREAIEAAKKLAIINDRMGDQKKLVEGLNPDAKFKALGNAMVGATGAITAATGAMGLFGESSEDTQKLLLKVQSAMALTQGLNALGEAKDSFMQLGAILGLVTPKVQANATATAEQAAASEAAAAAVTAQSEATAAQAAASEGAAVATKGLGAAMKGIGIGLIIGLIVILVENWDKLKTSLGFVTKEQQAYKDAVEASMKAAAQDTSKAVQSIDEVRVAFDMAKKGVISKREALEKYNNTLGDAMGKTDSLATAEKRLADKADAYIQMTMLKAQANAMFAKSGELAAQKMTVAADDQTSFLDKASAAVLNLFGQTGDAALNMADAQDKGAKAQEKSLDKQIDMMNTKGKELLTQMNELGSANGIKTEDQQALAKKLMEEAAKSFAVREQILKSQQERTLLLMKEGEAKNLKAQQFAYEDERRQIQEQLKEKQLTAGQAGALLMEAERSNQAKVEKIRTDAAKERLQKEQTFIQQLADLQEFQNLQAIKDETEKELYALDKAADQKRLQILADEKLTADQRRDLLNAIDADLEAHKKDLEKKRDADDKKKQRELNQREAAYRATVSKNSEDYFDRQRDELDVRIANLKTQYDADIQMAGDNALKKREIEDQFKDDMAAVSAARVEISKSESEEKMQHLKSYGQLAGAISGLVGEQTAVGKGFAVAAATIDTYAAVTATLKAAAKTPAGGIPGYAIAQAIAVGIAGIANVKKILAVQVPGGGGAASAPTIAAPPTVAAPITPQAQSTLLAQSSINAIGSATTGRSYVLDSDNYTSAERRDRIGRAARIN